MIEFQYSDGGRKKYGYRNKESDCAIRATAIAFNMPYRKVYESMVDIKKKYRGYESKLIAKDSIDKGVHICLLLRFLGRTSRCDGAYIKDQYIKDFPSSGTYILYIVHTKGAHVTVLKNGVLYDEIDSRTGAEGEDIYATYYWKVV